MGRHTEVWTTREDEAAAKNLMNEHDLLMHHPLVGIHPGSNRDYLVPRNWPPERFATVADHLIKNHDAHVLLSGDKEDAPICGTVKSRMQHPERCVDLCGRTTVRELCACVNRCDLFVSNDTGPMHISVAQGIPTVGLFGPSDWQAYGTYPSEIPFRMIRPQSGTGSSPSDIPNQRNCMADINTSDVVKECDNFL
jgi:heptosyltransferase-2